MRYLNTDETKPRGTNTTVTYETFVLCCATMVFSITRGLFLFNVYHIRGYQRSFNLSGFELFRILCFSNYTVKHLVLDKNQILI